MAEATKRSECVAAPSDIDADLTFETTGSAVIPERFQRSLSAFLICSLKLVNLWFPRGSA